MKKRLPLVTFLHLIILPHLMTAQSPKAFDAGELKLALAKLRVLGSVLYLSAHPDDENTAFLATMSKGRLYRTGYLSITRGEGGQNLLGPEQGDYLGIIRTQELLQARTLDGAEQFFTRAIDFGYSKTTEESLEFWGKDTVLADVVWVIRKFRPDVIVTRFTPDRGGHGNHTASAVLALEAFRSAADPKAFPEQLRYVKPWSAKRIVWNLFRSASSTDGNSVMIDLGAYSPLLGASFGEIAGESRSMHKSQGFGASERLGSYVNYFEHMDGERAGTDLFDGIETDWSRVPGSSRVEELLDEALLSFDPDHPSLIVPTLLEARRAMESLQADPWVTTKLKDLDQVIFACCGFRIDVLSDAEYVVPGDSVRFTVRGIDRSEVRMRIGGLKSEALRFEGTFNDDLSYNQVVSRSFSAFVPRSFHYTQPYSLKHAESGQRYLVASQQEIGLPEADDPLSFDVTVRVLDETIVARVPMRYRWVDPVRGELFRRVAVVPPVSLTPTHPMLLFADNRPNTLTIIARTYRVGVEGAVALIVPDGWDVSPSSISIRSDEMGSEIPLEFNIKPGKGASKGVARASFRTGTFASTQRVVSVDYPHIPPQTAVVGAGATLVPVRLVNGKLHVGYIMGAGDEIPDYLRQIGCSVDLLSDEYLETGDLSGYDAIVAGVRAYNVRDKLTAVQDRLMEYVKDGGRYVVQYVTRQGLGNAPLGPYPFEISRTRVSVENAPVTFPNPRHPLLLRPNPISIDDFSGWVQERGLYFADRWDSHYETVLVSHDPGETPAAGGLLYCRYGKGVYIYSGYSWFRQLPAGVPGAVRLFVNLISSNGDRNETP